MSFARQGHEEHERIVLGDLSPIQSPLTTSPSKSFDTLPVSVGSRVDTLAIQLPVVLSRHSSFARVNDIEHQRISTEIFTAGPVGDIQLDNIDTLPIQTGKRKDTLPIQTGKRKDTLSIQTNKPKYTFPIKINC
jgi:hypothetical protein